MSDRTTIQVTREQADELAARKRDPDETYRAVIARLLAEDDAATDNPHAIANEIAEQVAEEVAADVAERLDAKRS